MLRIIGLFCIALFFVCFIRIAVFRFTHIDMTEMRCMVTLWQWHVGAIVSILTGVFCLFIEDQGD